MIIFTIICIYSFNEIKIISGLHYNIPSPILVSKALGLTMQAFFLMSHHLIEL